MTSWDSHHLGEFVEIQTGPFGSQLHAHDYVVSGTPMVMPTNIGQRLDVVLDEIAYVSDADISRLDRYLVKAGDIVYSRRGDVEKCAYITEKQNGWLCGGGCLRIRVRNGSLDSKFLAYYLSTRESKSWILNSTVGSTMPNLNSSILLDFPLRVPPIDEQRAIAEVLSSLDDKIDLFHRQNKTLERLAETLFRQWFIDLADEKLGKLGDLVELHYGKGLKEELRTGQGYPVVGSSGVVGYHAEPLVKGPGIVIGRKGTLGKVIYLFEDFFPIDTTYFVQSKTANSLFYEYFLLKSLDFEDMNSDSAVPGLNREIALATDIALPEGSRRNQFNAICSDLFLKLRQNDDQISLLSRLRDSLLPKLMRGEAIYLKQ